MIVARKGLDGVVVVVIKVPTDEVVPLATAFAGVQVISTGDGAGIPVDAHSGCFRGVDPDVVAQVRVIPFYAGVCDGNLHFVRALGIIPSFKAVDAGMDVLLGQQGIIGCIFGSIDAFQLGKDHVFVFAQSLHGCIDIVIAIQHNSIEILQIHSIVVPGGNFHVGVHLLHLHDVIFNGKPVKAFHASVHHAITHGVFYGSSIIADSLAGKGSDNRL